jgi:hypothetical protein
MNVNKENRYVSTVETTTKRLNKFYQPHGLHTTFDSGKLIPIYLKEVLPNDVRKLKWSSVVRLLTPKFPTMDNAKLDTFFFYVRNRDVWDHWQEFCGYSKTAWTPNVEYKVPQIFLPLSSGGPIKRVVGDLADYLGIPVYNGILPNDIHVNALPFRAVCKIWNDYFRDENYQDELYFPTDETPVHYSTYDSSQSIVSQVYKGSVCPPVNRYGDYFSLSLPSPQKGDAVKLPLGDYAPVITGSKSDAGANMLISCTQPGGVAGPYLAPVGHANGDVSSSFALAVGSGVVTDAVNKIYLRADLSGASSASVNAIRLAFQTQKFLEQSARGGTRYVELLQSMFGVTCPDIMLNRAEFLGGKSFPLSLTPVTNLANDLGNVGGVSSTVSGDYAFKKHFTEHGFIIGFACVRTDRSYSQGVNRLWFRDDRTDFYYPVFSHIGEQPVLERELFVNGTSTDTDVFGYQEAWSEYRFSFNECSGYMRSGIDKSLNVWTYTDDYEGPPFHNSAWLTYQKEIIDRTIINPNEHQFIADFYFDDTLYSVVSKNSAPGLIDHY